MLTIEGQPFTCDDPGEGYVITNNVSCGNAGQDIDTSNAGLIHTLEYNQCTSSDPAGQCDFACASGLPLTVGDFNGDGAVDSSDYGAYINSVNADDFDKQSPWMFD